MLTETWSVDRLTPYADNPRKRSKGAVDKVAASIKEFGVKQPIVVGVCGHRRPHASSGRTEARPE